jgi:tetratricopeptide (TPR) repeat protein
MLGRVEAALEEANRGVQLARTVGPGPTAGALMMEAQALIQAGRLDDARDRFAEIEQLVALERPYLYEKRETIYGDIEQQAGRPHAAVPHYIRSLLWAEANTDAGQILFDLLGTAIALAATGATAEALEVQGLTLAQASELHGQALERLDHIHILDAAVLDAAADQLGAERAEAQRARGRAVPAARRVSRACELARAAVEAE